MDRSRQRFLLDQIKPLHPIDLSFNRDAWDQLEKIAGSNNMPHIMIYGPSGSGKKTIVSLFLHELFGSEVDNQQITNYKVTSSGTNTKKIVPILQSNHHIVVQPNNNNFDKYIIQDVITQYARQVPFQVFEIKRPFRAVVIAGIDQISKQAQMSLRSTMENYSHQCRMIMWCTSPLKVIQPLRSRCFSIGLKAPSEQEVQSCLAKAILQCELPSSLLPITAIETRDLRGAFRKLEALRWDVSDSSSYDTQIIEIVQLIIDRNSNNMIPIRARLYELMITNFTGTQIITSIVDNLINDVNITDANKLFICKSACLYESRNVVGRREIKHLEAFCLSVMQQVKLSMAVRIQYKKIVEPIPTTATAAPVVKSATGTLKTSSSAKKSTVPNHRKSVSTTKRKSASSKK